MNTFLILATLQTYNINQEMAHAWKVRKERTAYKIMLFYFYLRAYALIVDFPLIN